MTRQQCTGAALAALFFITTAGAQQVQPPIVPRLIQFSGVLKDSQSKSQTGNVPVTFSIYASQEDGAPLWTETQEVTPGADGNYAVLLGAASQSGVPAELFLSGGARWLGIQTPDQPEQPRVLLVSVPYALKAADADTLGGKPASAYVTVEQQAISPAPGAHAAAASQAASTGMMRALTAPLNTPGACSTVTSDGTAAANSIALFTTACNIEASPLVASSGKVGLATTTPSAYLDIYPITTAFASSATVTAQAIRGNVTANPSSASYGIYEGVRGQANDGGATNRVGTLKGFVSSTGTTSNQNVDALYGLYSQAQVNKPGGTAAAAYGIFANAVETAGTLSTGYGLYAEAQGTMATAYGVYSTVTNYSSGKPVAGYGVFIAPLTVSGTSFGLYQGGSGDKNYFAGKVGLGTSTPSALLEVNGTAKFDGAVTFAGGETYTGNVTTNDQLVSTVATGTAPLSVASTTQVANLNASLLDGLSASAFATTGANTFSGGQTINGNLNLTGSINSALVLQGSVTDPNTDYASANVIGGDSYNIVTNGAIGATIAGGGAVNQSSETLYPNTVSADFGTVSGGVGNTAGGDYSTVAGGYENSASGSYSIAAGGYLNIARGAYTFAGGWNAAASDNGSFVWCQENGDVCTSKGTNSFMVSAGGGVYLYSGPGGQGCYLTASAGSWACSSDRNLKSNVASIDPLSVLERVAQMPISQWSMKSDTAGHKHIGPMAQDFYAAFGLGDTDKYIAQGDAQGVALASIQGLYRIVQEKNEQIRSLLQEKGEEIQALKTQLEALEERIARK
ncbi:MAG: tail fiber domain-containing protein [Bryobacteraceae bacterium]